MNFICNNYLTTANSPIARATCRESNGVGYWDWERPNEYCGGTICDVSITYCFEKVKVIRNLFF